MATMPARYAQAWGMVRFFMDGDAGRWRPVMKDYIDRILKGDGPGRLRGDVLEAGRPADGGRLAEAQRTDVEILLRAGEALRRRRR